MKINRKGAIDPIIPIIAFAFIILCIFLYKIFSVGSVTVLTISSDLNIDASKIEKLCDDNKYVFKDSSLQKLFYSAKDIADVCSLDGNRFNTYKTRHKAEEKISKSIIKETKNEINEYFTKHGLGNYGKIKLNETHINDVVRIYQKEIQLFQEQIQNGFYKEDKIEELEERIGKLEQGKCYYDPLSKNITCD